MNGYHNRKKYLDKLIIRRGNNEVKIVTGSRRSGKSFLLMKIYRDYLISQGVPPKNIISISVDVDEDVIGLDFTNPSVLKQYIYDQIKDENEQYYVFLDEIQMVEGFERIVNGLNLRDNVDVYITGSNSKFLSSDIKTIFRGRGDEIRVYPLSFKEFCDGRSEQVRELWKEFYTYGGMPALMNYPTAEQKVAYLQRLWEKTYIDDVVERNKLRNRKALETIVDFLCSSIGSLVNPNKIKNTLQSVSRVNTDYETVARYLKWLEDAFLFEGAKRYSIKGKKYYESIEKYYCADIGLRNVRLNFRQQEISHIMENVIYNELRMRGYLVDVGVVEARRKNADKFNYSQLEVDFVATNGNEKYYIQSAYSMESPEKQAQEMASLLQIDDSFNKIVIVSDDSLPYKDEHGIVHMGLFEFLRNDNILS